MSLNWFHEFSHEYINEYNFGIYYEDDKDRESKRQTFLKNAMHIQNKAIFDSINEVVDKYRPYGLIG